jgi:xylulokinase
MPGDHQYVIGIDVGTGGVRTLAVSAEGDVAAGASVPFDASVLAPQKDRHEQAPEAWWDALCRATTQLAAKLDAAGIAHGELAGLAVDGTSGTIAALDGSGNPLRPAIMYNDPRATWEADELNRAAGDFCLKLGYQFNASYALAKIAWIKRHEPEIFRRTAHFVHQADYVVGRLIDNPKVSDYSNSLKTGYDLVEERWPAWIDEALGLGTRLPDVFAPGTRVGAVSAKAASETGLPEGLPVMAGATDGTAAFLASGARRPGDYNTTLGTTLVFKGISRGICWHPDGLVYCHKLPGGLWLPGAASNTGTEWINQRYPEGYPHTLDAEAAQHLPCVVLAYPLARQGERFPFLAPNAGGFCMPYTDDAAILHAAYLQGTAFVERLAYEVLDAVSGTQGGDIYSTGGGGRNDLWLQCRADVTGRNLHRPACAESAFGSAVLAAAGTIHRGWDRAVQAMVNLESTFRPRPERREEYDRLYQAFCGELKGRGYL